MTTLDDAQCNKIKKHISDQLNNIYPNLLASAVHIINDLVNAAAITKQPEKSDAYKLIVRDYVSLLISQGYNGQYNRTDEPFFKNIIVLAVNIHGTPSVVTVP